MKAGTSALFSALAEHPEILGSIDKEPGFWTKDAGIKAGPKAYLECWDRASKPGARWLLEGSTHYTKVPVQRSAAPYFRRVEGEKRFIYVTRNPVDRIRSQYEMSLAHGWFKKPIQEGLEPVAIWLSNYYMQIRPFIDCFGEDSICVVSHEEIKRDSSAVVDRVGRFLGVDPSGFPAELPRVNVSSDHRKLRAQALRKLLRAEDPKGKADISKKELHARLTAEVTPTEEHIALIHRELDEDLAKFEAIFGLNPWTGERSDTVDAADASGSTINAALASISTIRRQCSHPVGAR